VGIGGAIWTNAVIAVNTISNGLNFANFVARPDGTTSSQRTGVSFYGTFFNFPGDTGQRRTADIVSGFATGTWGTEYLSFNVGNGGGANDTQLLTIEQVRITTTTTSVLAATVSVSTLTGALTVAGGVGIGRSLFVQENIVQVGGTYSTLAGTYNLINTTATTVNFAGAATTLNVGATSGSTNVRNNLVVSGNLTVQGTTTIVDSTVTNIADPIITLGGGAGNAAPTVDDNKDRGVAFKWVNNGGTTSTGFFGYDDSTGYLTYIQTATITNEVVSGTKGAVDANLAGGTAMSLVYQSAVDTTAFLAAGTSGFILQTNGTGSAPTWVSAAGVSAGSATNSDSIRTIERTTNASHFLTFVDSNNATNAYELLYTTSSFSLNPSSGLVTITGSGADKLQVNTQDGVRLGASGATSYVRIGSAINGEATSQISFDRAVGATIFSRGPTGSALTELVRITNSGDVGVGSTPAFTNGTGLEIQRTGTATLRLDSATFATEFRGLVGGTELFQLSAGFLDLGTNATSSLRIHSTNNVTIGTTTDGGYKLQVNGSFAATTKSFVIDHPTKDGMVLRYGSLEGPENGVYIRGRCKGKGVIELPDYWTGLVDPDSITVTLTPIGKSQNLYVKEIKDNKVKIGGSRSVDCFYTVWAERKDVAKLEVEFKK
jgi:hypothetical protein